MAGASRRAGGAGAHLLLGELLVVNLADDALALAGANSDDSAIVRLNWFGLIDDVDDDSSSAARLPSLRRQPGDPGLAERPRWWRRARIEPSKRRWSRMRGPRLHPRCCRPVISSTSAPSSPHVHELLVDLESAKPPWMPPPLRGAVASSGRAGLRPTGCQRGRRGRFTDAPLPPRPRASATTSRDSR